MVYILGPSIISEPILQGHQPIVGAEIYLYKHNVSSLLYRPSNSRQKPPIMTLLQLQHDVFSRMENLTASEALTITSTFCTAVVLFYVVYMRFLHPLSKYPGPLVASLTNTFKAYYVYNLTLHEKLLELHMRYGPVVRVGPNHLHFWDGEAIAPIYKGGRNMGKTNFYDAFTAFNPNLFGGTNEDVR